jgi:hypothetical protein
MVGIMQLLMLALAAGITRKHHTRDERGEAVPWLIVLGAGIAIAYFAGDSVMAFAKDVAGNLGE